MPSSVWSVVVPNDQATGWRPAVAGPGGDPARALGGPVVVASILRAEGTTGVHTHVRELQRACEARNIPVEVVTPFSLARPLSAPIMGLRLVIDQLSGAASVAWYYHWHELFLRWGLRRRLSRSTGAIVYAQGPREARAALRARRDRAQRVVMVVHYVTSQADEWVDKLRLRRGGAVFRNLRRVEATVIPRLDGIVYVSAAAREGLLEWLPAAARVRSAVIHDFVRGDDLPRPPGPRRDLVTIGGLIEVKNHRYLLEVLAAAKRSGHVYTLDIVGGGPLRRTLEGAARVLDVAAQVRFLGARHDARRLLPGYRVYVHASYRESLSLAVIEATAAGLPVVVADSGGVREVCDEQHGATFWPLDDPDRAAKVLIELMEDEQSQARAAAASAARFHDAFDADVVVPRLLSFLFQPEPVARQAPGRHAHQSGSPAAVGVASE